jgi:chromosome segregation ATPase
MPDETTAGVPFDYLRSVNESLEGLRTDMDALRRESSEARSDVRVLQRDLGRVEQQLESLVDVLHRGNGKPSISSRLLLLENQIAEVFAVQETSNQRLEVDRRDRERFERESRTKTTAAVIAGIASIVAAVIAAAGGALV